MEDPKLLQPKHRECGTMPDIHHHIRHWINHRHSMWTQFTHLCMTYREEPGNLQIFCQHLMDYIAMGHFKIFEKLEEFYQSASTENQALNTVLLNKIALTTDIAVDFNDKYTEPKNLEDLAQDLSHLGEHLANRMEWEDQLIRDSGAL